MNKHTEKVLRRILGDEEFERWKKEQEEEDGKVKDIIRRVNLRQVRKSSQEGQDAIR